ncbi:MAG: ATP-binding cassette domain-containing protein [Alphaproteobacteria bacterium]|nr:ATP-binding cassette domain-containing protein [Alphaproteobacteria bacterium]
MSNIPSYPEKVETPTVIQNESFESGAASLGIVLGYFGYYELYEKLCLECDTTRNGSKIDLVQKAAMRFGTNAEIQNLSAKEIYLKSGPIIVEFVDNQYVVYEGIDKKNRVYINDPSEGPIVITKENFEKKYNNVALFVRPNDKFVKNEKPLNIFHMIWNYVKGMSTIIRSLMWASLLLAIPSIIIPFIMQIFVDRVFSVKKEWLFPLLIAFLFMIIIKVSLNHLMLYILRCGRLQFAINETLLTINKIFRLPASFFAQMPDGDIQMRIMYNADVAELTFSELANCAVNVICIIVSFIVMFFISPILSFIFLGVLFSILISMNIVDENWQNINQSILKLKTKLTASVMTGLSMMENLRASGRENVMFNRWADNLTNYLNKKTKFDLSTCYFETVFEFFSCLADLFVICGGAYLIMQGKMTLGGLLAFQTLVEAVRQSIMVCTYGEEKLQPLWASFRRIDEIFKNKDDTTFKTSKLQEIIPDFETLELRNITFGYSKNCPPLLKDFSMILTPGKRIAFVGSSGSGKSTLAKLANGTLIPWSGEVLLNGKPINQYTREQFYSIVGTVDQNIILFSGTVGENLTLFSPEYDALELQQGLKDASIEKELSERGPALEQEVLEEGLNFSGGQRQRLEIARALTYKTPVLILDEATSALDPIKEAEIDEAIRRRGCACIIIAHRMSTVRDSDEIVMLEQGKVVERGTHEELIALNGKYANLMELEGS